MRFVIDGKCRCCTNKNTATLEVIKTDNKIFLKIDDCVGKAEIELENEDLILLSAIKETEE